jgi:tyrosinase
MPLLVRREVSLEPPWDPTLTAYAKAVALMKTRDSDPKDPTSWTYQAAMHGTTVTPPRELWNGCQHGSWYFVVWHRMYVYYFEQIVRAAVVATGGPADWTLPYWNYGRGEAYAAIPPAFRSPTLPNGGANPLYVKERAPGINTGHRLPARATSAAIALERPYFIGSPEFGGGETEPGQFWTETGRLEQTPHNDVHSLVGGWMGNVFQAAQDPLFWLHHTNIDRLWAVWNSTGHVDPKAPKWTGHKFKFFDTERRLIEKECGAVVNTVTDLNYTYDKLQDPHAATAGEGAAKEGAAASTGVGETAGSKTP